MFLAYRGVEFEACDQPNTRNDCAVRGGLVLLYVALFALGIYTLLFVVLPRVRDTGMSGWWVLLSLFPVVNGFFYLFLIFRAPEYHFEGSSNAAEQA